MGTVGGRRGPPRYYFGDYRGLLARGRETIEASLTFEEEEPTQLPQTPKSSSSPHSPNFPYSISPSSHTSPSSLTLSPPPPSLPPQELPPLPFLPTPLKTSSESKGPTSQKLAASLSPKPSYPTCLPTTSSLPPSPPSPTPPPRDQFV